MMFLELKCMLGLALKVKKKFGNKFFLLDKNAFPKF
jgi:hypothetical protein